MIQELSETNNMSLCKEKSEVKGKKYLGQNNGKYGQIRCLLLMQFPDIDNPYVILSAHSVWEPTITEQTHCQVQTVGTDVKGIFLLRNILCSQFQELGPQSFPSKKVELL